MIDVRRGTEVRRTLINNDNDTDHGDGLGFFLWLAPQVRKARRLEGHKAT